MENGRTNTDKARRNEEPSKRRRKRQQDEAEERKGHADRKRVGHMPTVCVPPHDRLQQRSDDLVGQRERAEVPEEQVKRRLENRVDRRQKRLHHVVQQVAKADRRQNTKQPSRVLVRLRGTKLRCGYCLYDICGRSGRGEGCLTHGESCGSTPVYLCGLSSRCKCPCEATPGC